uniref:Uncharacterized protein n=1 Tax=Varanus komodoensis TaxID=61221 RepID=A0A8D2LEZ3_VARKO
MPKSAQCHCLNGEPSCSSFTCPSTLSGPSVKHLEAGASDLPSLKCHNEIWEQLCFNRLQCCATCIRSIFKEVLLYSIRNIS